MLSWLVILSLLCQPVAPVLAHYASSAPTANSRTFHAASAVAPEASVPREMTVAPQQAQQPTPGGAVVYEGGLENAADIPMASGHKYWVYMNYDSTASAYIEVKALQNGQQKGQCVAYYAGRKSCRFSFTPTTSDPLSLTVTSIWATPENVAVLVIDENSPTNRRVIYSGGVANLSAGIAVESGHRYLFYAAAFTGSFNVWLGYGWPVYYSHITEFGGVSGSAQFLRPVYYAYADEHDKFYIQVTNVAKNTTGLIALIDLDLPPASAADAERTFAKENACAANNGDAAAADPVSTRTGNFTRQEVDVNLPTRGLPLTFERSYNALDSYNGPLGHNWTHNYDTRIVDAGATVTWIAPRGSHLPYARNGDGSYTAGSGVRATLVKHPNGSYTVTQGGQAAYHFAAAGRLTALDDGRGNVTTLTYTGGQLTSIAAPDGRALSLTFDGLGRITQLTDPLGRTVSYQYSSGNLSAVTDRRGHTWTYTYDSKGRMTAFSDPQGGVVTNVYDSLGRVVVQRNPLNHAITFAYAAGQTVVTGPDNHATTYVYDTTGLLTSATDALGHTTSYTYDGNFNVTAVTDPLGRTTQFTWNDSACSFSSIADAMGHTTTLSYDARNNLLAITDPLGRSTHFGYAAGDTLAAITNTLGAVATFTYDVYGQMTSSTNARGETTATEYDLYGNLTAITDALGHTTHLSYDLAGRPTAVTDANGHTTTFLYDAGDNLLGTTHPLSGTTAFAYDLAGNLTAVTDANGHTLALAYDAAGRLITLTDALQGQTVFVYDAAGRVIRVTDANGKATHFAYDGTGRLVTVTDALNGQTRYAYDAAGNVISVTGPTNATTTFQYDALNRTVAITDALGHATWFGYNAVGNVVAALDPTGVLIQYTYDALDRPLSVTVPGVGQVAAYAYDPAGNLTAVTDANGRVTQYGYDALNRLAQVSDPLSHVTSYGYDPVGNLSAVTDANTHTRTYVYDALNRLVAASNPLGHTTAYGYDPVGNTTVISDAGGGVTTVDYDALDRPTEIAYPAAVAAPGYSVTYAYDALGRRVAMTDTTGVTTYHYDDLSRPLTITAPYAGQVAYRYDASGRRTHTLYPTGETVTYTYDAAVRLTGVQGWEEAGSAYEYDASGRLTAERRANGTHAVLRYDTAGRLNGITDGDWQNWLASTAYILDAAGNRIAVRESTTLARVYLPLIVRGYESAAPESAPSAPDPLRSPLATPEAPVETEKVAPETAPRRSWGDLWAWLTQWLTAEPVAPANLTFTSPIQAPPPEEALLPLYTYDARNQLTAATANTGTSYGFTYDTVGNRTLLTTTTETTAYTYDAADRLSAANGVLHTYDARGNLLDDGRFTYAYDGAGRLVQATSLTATAVYTYNGAGLRVAQAVNGVETAFTWDQALELPQLLATSDGTRYLHGLGLAGVHTASQWYYPHTDALGSIRRWSDAGGSSVGELTYDPYGGIIQQLGVIPSPLGFAGEWHDPTTGLQYLRARWYDPATGRFTQVDPFPGLLSLPGTQQPYAYALNNPLRYTDPSGEFVGALLGGLAIGAVAGGVSYALQHRSQPLACFLQDPDFWRAVAIGGVSGTVSGFVAGFFAPLMLLSSGVGTAMQIGGFIGMLSAFSSHVVTNVLNGRPAAEGVGWAMLSGAVFGALGGALGYGIRQWAMTRTAKATPPTTASLTQPIERHHLLPRQFRSYFKPAGLNIESPEFIVELPRDIHRLKPHGLHTGPDNWNRLWKNFITDNPVPNPDRILQHLDWMMGRFGLR